MGQKSKVRAEKVNTLKTKMKKSEYKLRNQKIITDWRQEHKLQQIRTRKYV